MNSPQRLSPRAEGKPLPAEMTGIINQLLGMVTWAGLGVCVASIFILVILISVQLKATSNNIDRLIGGTLGIAACGGVIGGAAGFANWLYG
jgi:hypothetical protein